MTTNTNTSSEVSTVGRTDTPKMTTRKALVIIVGLLLAYLPNYLPSFAQSLGITIIPDNPTAVLIWGWLAVGLLVAYIFSVERKNLSSIRLVKPSEKDVEWAFYFWGISMGLSWVASQFVVLDTSQGVSQITSLPALAVLAIIFTASITEEILYRGYVIERIQVLTGRLWLGALVSFVIFVIPHITFFGWEWLPLHSTGTAMIYVYYLWRRNLVGAMLLHLLLNLPILIPTLLS
jgi:membrane protease YdiL (CAAX protease family)